MTTIETVETQLVPLSGDMAAVARLFAPRCEGAARSVAHSAFASAAGPLAAARARALCKAAGVDVSMDMPGDTYGVTVGDIYWGVADELVQHAERTRIFSALYFLYLSGSRLRMRLPQAAAARVRLVLEAEADHDAEFVCLLDRASPADIARCPPHVQIAIELQRQADCV